MKYLWTSLPAKSDNVLMENVTPAKTRHIRGYGLGVTFTGSCYKWNLSISTNFKMLEFTQATADC
jgi:hypothetical protein